MILQQNPWEGTEKNPRFPIALVTGAVACMLSLMTWSIWMDYNGYKSYSAEITLAAQSSETAARILHLDEVLTMSARMAAATGDKTWIDRYKQYEGELDRLIKKMETMAPSSSGLKSAEAIDQANVRLVAMERTSFNLVLANRRVEAWELLNGPIYRRQKDIYATGIRDLLQEMLSQRQVDLGKKERDIRVSISAQGAASVLVAAIWYLALWSAASAWRRKASQYQNVSRVLQKNEEELRFRNILLATEQETSIDGILVVGKAREILSFNRRFVDMWGIPSEVAETKSDNRALQSVIEKLADPAVFLQKINYLYEHPQESSQDEIALRDGRTFDRYSAPMLTADGGFLGRVWYFRDITERKRYEERLAHLAAHDPLTGLPNRRLFEEYFNRTAARVKRGAMAAVMQIDVDNFKSVNDTLGHAVGDEVLTQVSALVRRSLREEDVLARMGGDEFSALLDDTDLAQAMAVAERARMAVAGDGQADAVRAHPTLSIGITRIEAADTFEFALSRADAAMYAAKDRGRNRVVCGDATDPIRA